MFFLAETCGRLWGPPIAVIIGVDSTYIIPNMLRDSGTPTATLVTDPIASPALSGASGIVTATRTEVQRATRTGG